MGSQIKFLGLLMLIPVTFGQAQYRPGGGNNAGGAASDAGGSFDSFGGEDGSFSDSGYEEGAGSLEETIPGIPGDDYPIFAEVPETSFICDGQVEGGYYADPEAECQVFHICASDGNGGLSKYSFLCPNGTIFNQQYFVCDWWFNVDCSLAEELYSLNEEVAAEREAYSTGGDGGAAGGAATTRGQDQNQGGDQSGNQNNRPRGSGSGAPQYQGAGSSAKTRGSSSRNQPRPAPSRGGSNGASPARGGTAGATPARGGSRGQAQSGGRKTGGSRVRGGTRGSQGGYLAPGGSSDNQASYGGASGGSSGGAGGDYDEIIAADVGYGAPDSFEGAGDFPLLNEYTRNARESVLNNEDSNENVLFEAIVDESETELMDKTA